MKKFKTIIMLLLVAIALYAQRTPRVTNDFKEGDLIFQVSQSRQSPFIQLATNSPWSHCGVIVEKEGKRDSRFLVGIGIYFGKPKKKETFIYNSS